MITSQRSTSSSIRPGRSSARLDAGGRRSAGRQLVEIDVHGIDLALAVRRSSAGTRCEPRKPPAPSTAMRGTRPSGRRPSPARERTPTGVGRRCPALTGAAVPFPRPFAFADFLALALVLERPAPSRPRPRSATAATASPVLSASAAACLPLAGSLAISFSLSRPALAPGTIDVGPAVVARVEGQPSGLLGRTGPPATGRPRSRRCRGRARAGWRPTPASCRRRTARGNIRASAGRAGR